MSVLILPAILMVIAMVMVVLGSIPAQEKANMPTMRADAHTSGHKVDVEMVGF